MRKRVLVAPLDWGLGHATRCIPIIRELTREHEVWIATSGAALPLLKQEFPSLSFLELPSYRATYASRIPLAVKILLQTPRFFVAIAEEHRRIAKWVRLHNFDVVISDNRFGCYSHETKSVFITHQVNIPAPRPFHGLVNRVNRWRIRKFDECWIPDNPNGITGKLTQSPLARITWIGMLSRFEQSPVPVEKKYEVLVLLSGPEPQRSIFESMLLRQLKTFDRPSLIVRGLPGDKSQASHDGPVEVVNHLPSAALQGAIEAAEVVISRSGYTTIMDLYFLQKKAIFVPTPGQPEQEYLAAALMKKRIAFAMTQDQFSLSAALDQAKAYTGFTDPPVRRSLPPL